MAKFDAGDIKQPSLANHDSSILDLSFAMDCTGSMGSYIHQAQQNIRNIVEEIVSNEKSDIHLSLVEYRDHPPQDSSFVTRVHDFTDSVKKMKSWLDGASASGGGDCPEAVADALHQVVKLSWRPEATKICVFIADAPPHGLSPHGDHFPNGCPEGLDCIQIANQMAEKGITLYMVGCEPAINQYREFFMALAHLTGGQYIPLGNAKLLSKVIIGGAQEEMSLQRLMEEVNAEVQQEAQQAPGGFVDEEVVSKRIHTKMASRGVQSCQLQMNNAALPEASDFAKKLSNMSNMQDLQKEWVANAPAQQMGYGGFGGHPFSFSSAAPPPPPSGGGFSFGGPPMMTAAPAGLMMPQAAPMGAPAMAGMPAPMGGMPAPMPMGAMDDYAVNSSTIDYGQSKRMVQKAMKMNKLK